MRITDAGPVPHGNKKASRLELRAGPAIGVVPVAAVVCAVAQTVLRLKNFIRPLATTHTCVELTSPLLSGGTKPLSAPKVSPKKLEWMVCTACTCSPLFTLVLSTG